MESFFQNNITMKKNAAFLFLLFFGLCISFLHAQNAVIPSGGNAEGIGGSSSYTIGQIVFEPSTGSNGTIIPGVQQPFEISIIDAIEHSVNYKLTSNVYPNPVSNQLQLKIENESIADISYKLIDMQGNLIVQRKIEGKTTVIDMSNYVPAVYILKVINNNKEAITYKIVKN